MILSTFLDQNVDKQKSGSKDDKPVLMICGTIPVVPNDTIQFIELTEVKQLITDKPSGISCFMVSEESSLIIEMCDRYNELFDFQLVLVSGVPECVYSSRLEQASYRLARIPYHSVVNGIREAAKMADLIADEKAFSSIYNKEQAGITRKSGNVKELRAFDAPSMTVPTASGDQIESDPDSSDDDK